MREFRPTRVEVDLEAIANNVLAVKPEGVELMAVVKADGYGHGAAETARAALGAGATWLGVALLEEGLSLREAGLSARILVLSELPPGSEKEALAAGITPTVYSEGSLERLSDAAGALGVRAAVHLKVDTGMHRVGIYPPSRTLEIVNLVDQFQCDIEGVWTHLARSEDDEATTDRQLEVFREVLNELADAGLRPRYVHAANSGAVMRHPESLFNLVRVGLALYGLGPAPGLAEEMGLVPALSWRSAVSQVKRLPAGERVSYGHRYALEREATVATIPVGYADGYPRLLSSRADVLIGGKRRRVAGTVTMDQILADCDDDEVEPGDEVVLIGRQGEEGITASELAELAGTINYEIVCGISGRVPRHYREER